MFLNFEEYKNLNGNISDEDMFAYYEPIAYAKLDYYTQGRIRKMEDVPESVKMTFVRIVDLLDEQKDRNLKACSNDGVSVTYRDLPGVDTLIMQLIREMLPKELTFRGACV